MSCHVMLCYAGAAAEAAAGAAATNSKADSKKKKTKQKPAVAPEVSIAKYFSKPASKAKPSQEFPIEDIDD